MPVKQFNFKLSRKNITNQLSIGVVKNDINGNQFNIQIVDDSQNPIDLTGCTVTITLKKSDNTIVIGNPTVVEPKAGRLSYTLTTNDMACIGNVTGVIQVYGASTRITTSQFVFKVYAELNDGSGVTSSNDYPLIAQIVTTENNRVTAENSRAQAESDRVLAENQRVNAENARQAGFTDTVNALNNAKSAAETATTQANTARDNANTATIQANTARDNANNAANTANTAVTNANNATAAANQATTDAINAKNSAISAAQAANAVKDGAVTATTSASNAAYEAYNAASDANTAADNARQAAYDIEITDNEVKGNEDKRVANENARIQKETERLNAESDRLTFEADRKTFEGNRKTAETNGINAESARVIAETNRVTAENNRVSAETSRVTAETNRVSAESIRVTNENNRQTGYASMIQNSNIIPKAPVTNYAAIATTYPNPQNGWTTRAIDTGKMYRYNSSNTTWEWVDTVTASSYDTILNMVQSSQMSTPTDNYGQVISLPSTALKGAMKITVSGLTVNQLVKNGNFANGTTGWDTTNTTVSVSGNELTFTATAQYGGARQNNLSSANSTGHKYYVRALVKADSNNVCLLINDGVGQTIKTHSGSGNYELLSMIRTIDSSATSLYVKVRDDRTSGWTQVKAKDIMAIDLTASGIDTWTQAQCDIVFGGAYFEGMASVSNLRLRSVGKNLVNLLSATQKIGHGIRVTIDGKDTLVFNQANDISYIYSNGLVKSIFAPITQYTASFTAKADSTIINPRFGFHYTDGTREPSSNFTTSWTKYTRSSNASKTVDFIYIDYTSGTGNIYLSNEDFQIEQGSIATSYEPYSESIINLPDLRQINSIKDEFQWDGTLVKRISERVLQASDITYIYSSYQDVDVAFVLKPIDSSGYNNTNTGWATLEGYSEFTGLDTDIANVGKFSLKHDATRIKVLFAKNSLGTDDATKLATAKTALAGKKLTYVLATPQNIITDPQILDSQPNGTIIQECVIKDNAKYNAGVTIANTNYPIKNLTKVIKMVGASNEELIEYPIDLSTCTVAGNGQSFTSTALSNGDYVYYEYEITPTIFPIINISYPQNLRAVVDGNVNQISKLDGKVENLEAFTVLQLLDLATRMTLQESRKATAQVDSSAADVATLKTDFNSLLAKLRAAGLMGV